MDKPATPLPCPFCGEQCAVLNEDIKWAGYQPSCLEVRTGYDSSPDAEWRAEAIAAWNRRVPDPTAINAELVGALEEIERKPFPNLSQAPAYIDSIRAIARTALARAKENSNGH